MKFLVLMSLILTSFSSFAAYMCPFRSFEVISCHERRKVNVSICEDSAGQYVMTYKHPARNQIEIYPAIISSEDSQSITFTKADDIAERFELNVEKTIGHRARALLDYVSEGVDAQLSLECIIRNSY